MAERPLILAAAGRPFPGETVSGDAWAADWHEGTCRLAVIDGLGHGPLAAEAAQAARAALAGRPDLGPVEAVRLCHAALSRTRGAAMWIGRVDMRAQQITFAGVGNVEAVLWQPSGPRRLAAQRGVVGAVLPTLRLFECPLEDGWLLLVHTDGIRDRFDVDGLPDALSSGLQALVDGLLLCWGRATDDALVVAVQAA